MEYLKQIALRGKDPKKIEAELNDYLSRVPEDEKMKTEEEIKKIISTLREGEPAPDKKIQDIIEQQGQSKKVFDENLIEDEKGDLEKPTELNDEKNKRGFKYARVKDCESVAKALEQIYKKFEELGFNVKKEEITNGNEKMNIFAIEIPHGYTGNRDLLKMTPEDIKRAVDVINQNKEKEKRGEIVETGYICCEAVGNSSKENLEKALFQKSDSFKKELNTNRKELDTNRSELSERDRILEKYKANHPTEEVPGRHR